MAVRRKYQKEEHIHDWQKVGEGEFQCSCNKYKLTPTEFRRRADIYDKAYEAAKNSESCKRFFMIKDAWLKGYMGTVKKLAAISRRNLENQTGFIPDPDFNDPRYDSKCIRY